MNDMNYTDLRLRTLYRHRREMGMCTVHITYARMHSQRPDPQRGATLAFLAHELRNREVLSIVKEVGCDA